MKKFIIALCVCLVAVAVICALFVDVHVHEYSNLNYDAQNHWHECPDDGAIDEDSVEAHEDLDGNYICDSCGYVLGK